MRQPGRAAFTAKAIPAIKPPPLTGTNRLKSPSILREQLQAQRGVASDGGAGIVRMQQEASALSTEPFSGLEARFEAVVAEHHAAAECAGPFSLERQMLPSS